MSSLAELTLAERAATEPKDLYPSTPAETVGILRLRGRCAYRAASTPLRMTSPEC